MVMAELTEMTEEDKVRVWMKGTVKLEQYTQILIDNGYDNMESIIDITMDDLQQMGVEKIGHKRKIYKNAQKLANINESQAIKPIYHHQIKQKDQEIAPSSYSIWKCKICDTENIESSLLCTLCGVKRNFVPSSDNEGSNVECGTIECGTITAQ